MGGKKGYKGRYRLGDKGKTKGVGFKREIEGKRKAKEVEIMSGICGRMNDGIQVRQVTNHNDSGNEGGRLGSNMRIAL